MDKGTSESLLLGAGSPLPSIPLHSIISYCTVPYQNLSNQEKATLACFRAWRMVVFLHPFRDSASNEAHLKGVGHSPFFKGMDFIHTARKRNESNGNLGLCPLFRLFFPPRRKRAKKTGWDRPSTPVNNVPLIRRGQDSNLQSSGHEPDELTNSSTPLLPLLFRTPNLHRELNLDVQLFKGVLQEMLSANLSLERDVLTDHKRSSLVPQRSSPQMRADSNLLHILRLGAPILPQAIYSGRLACLSFFYLFGPCLRVPYLSNGPFFRYVFPPGMKYSQCTIQRRLIANLRTLTIFNKLTIEDSVRKELEYSNNELEKLTIFNNKLGFEYITILFWSRSKFGLRRGIPDSKDYPLLGDDILITDKQVALQYRKLLDRLNLYKGFPPPFGHAAMMRTPVSSSLTEPCLFDCFPSLLPASLDKASSLIDRVGVRSESQGQALNLENENVGIVVFGSDTAIKEGDLVKRKKTRPFIPVFLIGLRGSGHLIPVEVAMVKVLSNPSRRPILLMIYCEERR
ncbi:hypothetical protein FXO37_27774 [Capsicum annuum]|nr:hypothetical protein FXO37_27774 [Capsicum annuum]